MLNESFDHALYAEDRRGRLSLLSTAANDSTVPDPAGPDGSLGLQDDARRAQRGEAKAVARLARALESKDTTTRAHSQRVRRYAVELTRAVEPALLDDPSVEYGFLLHDVGKLAIPDGILLKPGPLTSDERLLIERHTLVGHEITARAPVCGERGAQIVRSHHERWDGFGYPDGLAGTEIPLGARIFAVADALDAITSDRPYRVARSWREAGAEIVSQSGRQFDPTVVRAARQLGWQFGEIRCDAERSTGRAI